MELVREIEPEIFYVYRVTSIEAGETVHRFFRDTKEVIEYVTRFHNNSTPYEFKSHFSGLNEAGIVNLLNEIHGADNLNDPTPEIPF